MKLPVFMDYHSTTPTDTGVLDSMIPYFREHFGNPASRQHKFGWIAEEAVESARKTIAGFIQAEPREIIFTSGATESNNLAIKGITEAGSGKKNHIITAATEHKSVIDVAKKMAKRGFDVTYLGVDEFGLISVEELLNSIRPETLLVTVMMANNEIGTINDIAAIGKICRGRGVLFHTDAAQAAGYLPIDVKNMNIDLLSVSSHKIYGPKGIGLLYVRKASPKIRIAMQMDGGGHEQGIRSGTLNVPAIVGFGKAVEIVTSSMHQDSDRLLSLRDRMWKSFSSELDHVYLNGHPVSRLPNNLSVTFLNVDDNVLMMNLKDIAISTGSACTSSEAEPSHVLKALRLDKSRLHSTIRFGLGRYTTDEEVDYVISRVIETVKKIRNSNNIYHN